MKKALFLILPLLLAFSLHEFHLSNAKIVYNETGKTLQITIKCFVDDIEKAINNEHSIVLELGNDREIKKSDSYVMHYFKNNFEIALDSKTLKHNFIGKEIENDIVFFYFEIDSVTAINTIQIRNSILINEFTDQQNVVRLKIYDKKRTVVFTKSNFKETFSY